MATSRLTCWRPGANVQRQRTAAVLEDIVSKRAQFGLSESLLNACEQRAYTDALALRGGDGNGELETLHTTLAMRAQKKYTFDDDRHDDPSMRVFADFFRHLDESFTLDVDNEA